MESAELKAGVRRSRREAMLEGFLVLWTVQPCKADTVGAQRAMAL